MTPATPHDELSDPAGRPLDAEGFRRAGHALVDWIADYRERIAERPVAHLPPPGAIRAKLPPRAPEHGESMAAILADLDSVVMPGIVHWQHPGWFAYFPANSSYESILGELASAGLGVQGMLWSTSPACTEIETHVLDWLVHAMGLPERFLSEGGSAGAPGDSNGQRRGGGVLQDTASSAALVALVAARERATAFATDACGIGAFGRAIVVYTSDQAHSSIEKAARLAGLGKEFVRLIPVDATGAMRVDLLEEAIARDRAAGHLPAFVSATVGTTGVNAIDPVEQIARVCRAHGLWLHVDAAMSGTAALCEEFRFVNAGAAHADSWCFNPHKWMPVNFDCDVLWVADRAELVRALSVLPEYLRNAATESGKVIDYRDWQIPLGRRFRALKLWMTLRMLGAQAIRERIRMHVSWAAEFAALVAADARFELLREPSLSLVCFASADGDEASRRLLERANATGRVALSHARVAGRYALRLAVGGPLTRREDVLAAWETLAGLA